MINIQLIFTFVDRGSDWSVLLKEHLKRYSHTLPFLSFVNVVVVVSNVLL